MESYLLITGMFGYNRGRYLIRNNQALRNFSYVKWTNCYSVVKDVQSTFSKFIYLPRMLRTGNNN